MTVKLKNGDQFSCLGVHGGKVMYQGVNRDSLTFLFEENTNVEEISTAFSSENMQTISLLDSDGGENVHENYTIRVNCGKGRKDSVLGYGIEDDTMIVWVTMAQSTVSERLVLEQQQILDMLIVSALEGEE